MERSEEVWGGRTAAPQHVSAACACNVGRRRANNEDNFLFAGQYMPSTNNGLDAPLARDLPLRRDRFFAVFDGMGGGDYGELASFTAAEAAHAFLEKDGNVNPCDITPSLARMCREVSGSVFQKAQNCGSEIMGATLAGIYFSSGQAWAMNVGDSRVFLLRNGRLRQISRDHTDEAYMKENGITGRKPYLTQYLGVDPEQMKVVPYVRNFLLRRGDVFLICSDGVTDMVEVQEIEEILQNERKPRDAADYLVDAALQAGGRDNITAIAGRVY